MIFENASVHDVLDIDGDTNLDVIWRIGSQVYIELIDTPTWTDILEIKPLPLKIFPNPTPDFLTFELPKEKMINQILITDVSGKQILIAHNKSQIDLQFLSKGSYFLIVKTNSEEIFGGMFLKN